MHTPAMVAPPGRDHDPPDLGGTLEKTCAYHLKVVGAGLSRGTGRTTTEAAPENS